MSKMDKKLVLWEKEGLLTSEQAQKIREFEESYSNSSWLLYGFLGLGAAIVLIGIISIIAANWKAIPASIKLLSNFSIFGLGIYFVIQFWKQKKELYFEAGLLFVMLYSFPTIGLVSQIYNTGGEFYQAGILWSVMNFGFLFLTRKKLIPSIWACVFFSSISFFAWEDRIFSELFGRNILPLYLALPFFCLFFTLIFKKYYGEYPVTKVFRRICFVVGAIGIIMVESQVTYLFQKPYLLKSFLPGYILLIIGCAVILRAEEYRPIQKKLVLSIVSLYTISMHLPVLRVDNEFLVAALTIAIFTLAAIYMGSLKYKKLFETFLVFIFIRFFILYLQAFGGLARTGIGFIVSGMIMIGLVMLWHKKRSQINNWVEGFLK